MPSSQLTARAHNGPHRGAAQPSDRARPPHLEVSPFAVRRYLVAILALGTPVLALTVVTPLEAVLAILVVNFAVLLTGAVMIARRTGPDGVRRLFSGLLHWRIGVASWALVTAAIPATALVIAAATGTLLAPPDGWVSVVTGYLLFVFVIGTLLLNLWEETAWQGLVQRHLTQRHGLLKGAILTGIPFAVLHVPLSFAGDVTLREGLVATAVLFVAAPFLRYLMGHTDQRTGGSLLAVGVLHAAFNATGSMAVLDGGWQHFAAVLVVASIAMLGDHRRGGLRQGGSAPGPDVAGQTYRPVLSKRKLRG